MDWIVAPSAAESAGGDLAPETEAAARAALAEHGCVLLRGALPVAAVAAMHREFVARFGSLNYVAMETEAAKPPPNRFLRVGGARYDIVVPMTGAPRAGLGEGDGWAARGAEATTARTRAARTETEAMVRRRCMPATVAASP